MALPASWADVYARLAYVLGADPDSAAAWLSEAVRAVYGVPDLAALTRPQRQVAFQKASGVVLALEELGELAFAIDQRQIVAAAFARYFAGVALDGPPWRISGYENERPSHAEWLGALSDF